MLQNITQCHKWQIGYHVTKQLYVTRYKFCNEVQNKIQDFNNFVTCYKILLVATSGKLGIMLQKTLCYTLQIL